MFFLNIKIYWNYFFFFFYNFISSLIYYSIASELRIPDFSFHYFFIFEFQKKIVIILFYLFIHFFFVSQWIIPFFFFYSCEMTIHAKLCWYIFIKKLDEIIMGMWFPECRILITIYAFPDNYRDQLPLTF